MIEIAKKVFIFSNTTLFYGLVETVILFVKAFELRKYLKFKRVYVKNNELPILALN